MTSDPAEESFAALFEETARGLPRGRGLRPGETVEVVVVQVGKETVFVEFDAGQRRQQGFIDPSDLRSPDGALQANVGDRLRARVVESGGELGLRLVPTIESAVAAGAGVSVSAGSDPDAVKVAVGQVVSGEVTRVESYGVFLQIDGTRGRAGRGLLPTVELGVPRGADLRKAFALGTKLKAKVLELAEGKIRLSLRGLKDDEERAQFEGFREKEKAAEPLRFGTFADLRKSPKRK